MKSRNKEALDPFNKLRITYSLSVPENPLLLSRDQLFRIRDNLPATLETARTNANYFSKANAQSYPATNQAEVSRKRC